MTLLICTRLGLIAGFFSLVGVIATARRLAAGLARFGKSLDPGVTRMAIAGQANGAVSQ